MSSSRTGGDLGLGEEDQNDADIEEDDDVQKNENNTRLLKRKRGAEYAKERRRNMGEALKTKEADRKKKAKAMEELGKLCLQCNVVTPEIVDNLAPHYHNRIYDELKHYVTDNPSVNPTANRSCVNCSTTCGPHGCGFGCECFLEHRVCVNACASYVCNAMPHKILQKKVEANVESFGNRGKSVAMLGLLILEDCKEGEIIMEYTGPRLNKKVFQSQLRMESTQGARYYMEAGDKIIKGDYGNEARYVNSSCKPNCKYYLWEYPDGSFRVFLTAIKNIKSRTFLHAKYDWGNFVERCLCQLTAECKRGNVYL